MKMQSAKCKMHSSAGRLLNFRLRIRWRVIFTLCALHFALCVACSIPNLEEPECTESRGAVKEFYSYHFGNEMKFTEQNLKPREKFLSPELIKLLQRFVTDSEPFTLTTNDEPKAFRVSGCTAIDASKADVRVLLFWRDDTRSEELEIHVETVKQNDKWLINNIYNEQVNLQENLNH